MRLTTSGTVFTIGGVALVVAAYRFGIPAFLPAGLLLLALVACSLLAGWALGRRVRASLDVWAPAAHGLPVVRAGAPVRIRTRLDNPLPFGTGEFTLTLHTAEGFGPEQRARIPALPARAQAAVDADFTPVLRGVSGLEDISTEFAGPFGLAVRRVRLQACVPVAVAPAELASPGAAPGEEPDPAHAPRTTRGTGGRDFETRPYVPGDDLRHVHWASTARLGQLMVRTEAKETGPRLDAVIDLHADSDQAEALLTAVAAAARTASHDGASVSLSTPEGTVTAGPGRVAELDLFLARLTPGANSDDEPRTRPAGQATTVPGRPQTLPGLRPAGGLALLATDDPDPRGAAARLLAPGVRARVWSTAELRDASVTARQLADGLVADLPWRTSARWVS